jgi:hypothetical protein
VSVLSGWGIELARMQHSHNDGTYHEMEEVTAHDSSSDDPERGWSRGRIFRCKSCSEEIRVLPADDSTTTDASA